MKKFIIGLIVGIFVSLSASVYAEEIKTLVGRAIEGEFPVHIDGKTLNNKALVIEGTSYLPVREFGESVGYAVYFDADLGITLKKEGAVVNSEYKKPDWAGTVTIYPPTEEKDPELTLDVINSRIDGYKSELVGIEFSLAAAKISKPEAIPAIEAKIKELKDKIAELETKKAALTGATK